MINTEYQRLIEAYREWLGAMNYATACIKTGPRKICEFFEWMNDYKIENIEAITNQTIAGFFEDLFKRKNTRTGGGLGISYIRDYYSELRRFSRYLYQTGQGHIDVSIQLPKIDHTAVRRDIYTLAEIEKLYEACSGDPLGLRDRVMLSVYYGCGLRRNEGISLELKDIQFQRSMIYVRKGKNYTERYVPMVGRVANDLLEYLNYGRPYLKALHTGNHLFVGYRGGTITGQMLRIRLRNLKKKARIDKEGSLHMLRHSIATHLLEAGMSYEQIARFLGHTSLESTQIYTHIRYEK